MPFPSTFLAISLPDNPGFLDNLQYQATGILVVLFTLGLLAVAVSLLGKVFIALDKRQALAAASTGPAVTPAAADETIPAPVFAAIAAAVATALGDRHVVIHGVQAADPRENLAWGAEGRRSIYAGKNLR